MTTEVALPQSRELGLPRLRATTAAEEAIAEVVSTEGPVIVVLSAGCCGGSTPMCLPRSDLRIGSQDVLIGCVAGAPVYIARRQLEAWPHVEVLLDVEPGMPDGLSLPAGRRGHFICWFSSVPLGDRVPNLWRAGGLAGGGCGIRTREGC